MSSRRVLEVTDRVFERNVQVEGGVAAPWSDTSRTSQSKIRAQLLAVNSVNPTHYACIVIPSSHALSSLLT